MIPLGTKIKRMTVPSGKRILVTSDIHGHLDYLKQVLNRVSFSDDDLLFIVGDMVEKGPDSLDTLRYVMKLCERGNVIPLIGNVDAHRLRLIYNLSADSAPRFYKYILKLRAWCGRSFYDELAAECGYVIHSPEDMLLSKSAVIAHFEKEFEFLASLPTIVETQSHVFVHGGLLEKHVSDNEGKDLFELTKFDAFMENTPHTFDKYVVVGHWPVCLYNTSVQQLDPIINREKRIISIDGGCGVKKVGQLNLLIIPDVNSSVEDISHVSYDALPAITALDDQSASDDSTNIYWPNSKIRVIERGEEFSYVEHLSSGRTLHVLNSYIKKDTDCDDYTDYALPVKRGDKMSLVVKTAKGYYCKKDGVFGWYYGRYENAE